jgi:hypothetical protein
MEQTLQGDVEGVDIEDTNVWGVPLLHLKKAMLKTMSFCTHILPSTSLEKGLEHLTLQYPPHHTLGKKSWSDERGGHKMCEEGVHGT